MEQWKLQHLKQLAKLSELFSFEGRNRFAWNCNIVLEDFWRTLAKFVRRLSRQKLVCVVGSYGKTSTVRALLTAIEGQADDWTKLNLNCFADVYISYLRQLGKPIAVCEIGIGGPGQMEKYAEALTPDLAIFTALGSIEYCEHVQNFQSREHLLSEKARIIRHIRDNGTLLVNADYPELKQLCTPGGVRLSLFNSGEAPAQSAALAACAILRIPDKLCRNNITRLIPVPARMEHLRSTGGVLLVRDDYKATLDTFLRACEYFRALGVERKFLVISSLDHPNGNLDGMYTRAGLRAAEVFDQTFVVGEEHERFLRGWIEKKPAQLMHKCADIAATITKLNAEVQANDAVLITGDIYDRVGRVALAAMGKTINCNRMTCHMHSLLCEDCPLL
jgi:UDP-N-acetylmuramyl pentapeptide synthase